jgi:Protein tyrosine and serine/threonine kinase
MSPELLSGDQSKSTTASDVYAFAMTCYVSSPSFVFFLSAHDLNEYMITMHNPFDDLRETTVRFQVGIEGKRPQRVSNTGKVDVTDELWSIIQRCWGAHPATRPPIRDVVIDLYRLCSAERPLRLLSIGAD